MNNCRAGLYSFASTTTWLHETGMASPPLLVMLGLTLPDSRILSGIASIGLTLANIAIILPHLRQPILDSMHALEGALAHEKSTQEQIITLSPDKFEATQPVDLPAESPVLAPVPPCDKEHQSPSLACSATVKSACSADAEPPGCPNVESEVAPQTKLLPPAAKTDDDQVPSQIQHSLDAESSERRVSSSLSHLFLREGRSPLYIPLPVPDAMEVAFFDTEDATLSDSDLGEECSVAAYVQDNVPREHSTTEECGRISGKDGQLVVTDLASTQGRVEIGGDSTGTDEAMSVVMEKVAPPPTTVPVQDHRNPVVEDIISDLPPVGGATVSRTQERHSLGERKGLRPESLEFIPQSVVRRYPSAPAGHCFGHRAFSSGHDHQVSPAPPHILVHNPAMLLDGTRSRASYSILEGHWRAPFLPEAHPTKRSMGGQPLAIEASPAQDPLKQGPTSSPPEAPTVHGLTPLGKYPTHRRRLGVLARAALRDRRSTVRRRSNDEDDDGSSISDSDSDFDSDSQHSSGSSSGYGSMLPHMLGADLIAAIDANSESELNLVGPGRTLRTPLDVYEDFLISEDSAADVSMIMHVSSNDDTSDAEVRVDGTFRSLTYEDIQQWASGVVEKCVRQVCRSHVPAQPSSPSQASDVCAERPSGSGVSQCPLSGLHCKLGGAALTAPRTKELPVSLPPTSVLPSRKRLQVWNLRDIPEFVPRQRQVSMVKGRVEGPRRPTVNVTRDAATRVIARMENRSGFNTRQWLVGTEEKRMVNTAGGRQGTLRCA
ncbi:hypothetical protein OG21DRAFT_114399 [Imleria badia]|nr:hypothetical protein OG21DRAFT_114399 [Imleria badia]